MFRRILFLSAWIFAGALMSYPALANRAPLEPTQSQKIMEIKVDLGPSLLWESSQHIGADIPLKLLTNGSQIIAIQVGDDRGSDFVFQQKNGQVIRNPMDPVVVPIALMRKNTYSLQAKFIHLVDRELFSVDATELDPQKGGIIKIKYLHGFLRNNYLQFLVRPVGDHWEVSVSDSFDSAPETRSELVVIHATTFGLGLAYPKIVRERSADSGAAPVALSDPRYADELMKVGESNITQFERNPIDLGFAKFALRASSVR